VFGFNAVQFGLLDHDLLRTNRMPFKFRCDEPGAGGACDVLTDLRHLPFAANSVDLVVLPHVLEFSADPHQVLREVERVLVPEGHVLVSGFNPYSMWGVRRGVRRGLHRVAGRREPAFPWVGGYLSMRRIKDWLKLLGFEPHAGWFGCYAPPVTTERWLRRWRFLESAGSRWWPFLGASMWCRPSSGCTACASSPPNGASAPRGPRHSPGGAEKHDPQTRDPPNTRPTNTRWMLSEVVEIFTDGAAAATRDPGAGVPSCA